MTTQLDLPPRPAMPKPSQRDAMQGWLDDLKAWQQHPAIVAQRVEEERREEERVQALRPVIECGSCSVERTGDPVRPWTVVGCGPHRVDHLMRQADGFRHAYRPVPLKYRDANPDHLMPALRAWDGSTSLYLTGPVGTGKTYQAAALVRHRFRVFDRPPTTDYYQSAGFTRARAVVWANVPKLLEDLRRSFDAPDTAPEGLEHAPLLVLDDIGAEKPSEWVEERLYCVVNERYESGLPIIVTSNLTPTQLGQRLGARLTSRLAEMCDVYGLGGKDRRLGAA